MAECSSQMNELMNQETLSKYAFATAAGKFLKLIHTLSYKWLGQPCLPQNKDHQVNIMDMITRFGAEPDVKKILINKVHQNNISVDPLAKSSRQHRHKSTGRPKKHTEKNGRTLFNGQHIQRPQEKDKYYRTEALNVGTSILDEKVCNKLIAMLGPENWLTLRSNNMYNKYLNKVVHSILLSIQHQHNSLCHLVKAQSIQNSIDLKPLDKLMASSKSNSPFKSTSKQPFGNIFQISQDSQDEDTEEAEEASDTSDTSDDEENDVENIDLYNGLSLTVSERLCKQNNDKILRTVNFLMRCALRMGVRRDGNLIVQRKYIEPLKLFNLNDGNGYRCSHVHEHGECCNLMESEHATDIHSRQNHVYKIAYSPLSIGGINSFDTAAWEVVGTVKEWINECVQLEKHPDYFNDLLKSLNTISERIENNHCLASLPMLDRKQSRKKYGPTYSFKNGIFFMKTCTFIGYREFHQAREQGQYNDLVSIYTDVWFFEKRYNDQFRGDYDPSMIDRPEEYRYQNFILNKCCCHCGQQEHYHKKTCAVYGKTKQAFFNQVKCNRCDATFSLDEVKANIHDLSQLKCDCNCDDDCNSDNDCDNDCSGCASGCVGDGDGDMKRAPELYVIDIAKAIHSIQTPFFSSILDSQFNDTEHNFKRDYLTIHGIAYWFLALMGFFIEGRNPNQPKQGWHVMPFIIGKLQNE
tara:strand:- start:6872 stop:8950 length:2079 start_codon:yes stop_codon:yes gene_type:complete